MHMNHMFLYIIESPCHCCMYFREHAPSIIFMDEIDSIGSSRLESGSGGRNQTSKYIMELVGL